MDGSNKSYVISLGEVVEKYAKEAKKDKELEMGTDKEQFMTGYLSGFRRIVTLMQQQAEINDIPLDEISLDRLNEIDLI